MAGISPNFFPPPDSSGEMPAEEARCTVRELALSYSNISYCFTTPLGPPITWVKTIYIISQNKDIQKCNFHYKTVRRFFTGIAGGHVLSKCPKERHSPPWNIKFSICFQGGDCLSLGHLLRTWRTEKIPYAKLCANQIETLTSPPRAYLGNLLV